MTSIRNESWLVCMASLIREEAASCSSVASSSWRFVTSAFLASSSICIAGVPRTSRM